MSKQKTYKGTNLDSVKEAIEKLPNPKREFAESLLDKVIFMNDELEKLQNLIISKGCTEEYKNGANQYGIKIASEMSVYNNLIKNYNAAIKKLLDIIPEESGVEKLDELMQFLVEGSNTP